MGFGSNVTTLCNQRHASCRFVIGVIIIFGHTILRIGQVRFFRVKHNGLQRFKPIFVMACFSQMMPLRFGKFLDDILDIFAILGKQFLRFVWINVCRTFKILAYFNGFGQFDLKYIWQCGHGAMKVQHMIQIVTTNHIPKFQIRKSVSDKFGVEVRHGLPLFFSFGIFRFR